MTKPIALGQDRRQDVFLTGFLLASGLSLIAMLAGAPLAGSTATAFACVMLLVFGLPHGTLDLELIKAQVRGPETGLLVLLLIYLGLAAIMYALWTTAPELALAAFVVISIVHFSEDWQDAGSPFLALGQAAAVLAAPTLLHRQELNAIFIGLTNRADAHLVTDGLTLIGPTSVVVGLVAMAALWSGGRKSVAAAGLVVLAGMVLLPPIFGFALYFCLFHSPRHLSESLSAVRLPRGQAWFRVILPLTLAAGAIAAAIYGLQARTGTTDRLIAASFMTLSVLTAPHMMAPMIMRRLSRWNLFSRRSLVAQAVPFTGR